MKNQTFYSAVLLMLLIAGCASSGLTTKVSPLTQEQFPAKRADLVAIYTNPPSGGYTRVARLEVQGNSETSIDAFYAELMRQAALVGADGLIEVQRITNESDQTPEKLFERGSRTSRLPPSMVATAIRLK